VPVTIAVLPMCHMRPHLRVALHEALLDGGDRLAEPPLPTHAIVLVTSLFEHSGFHEGSVSRMSMHPCILA